ncbi:uncharacterized protein LOC124354557 [Homalodisca vitripennis]|uniref:uncharacterized protein LOC124354557 n=1 Tax=Homalodisca vitripennis TaxID=197043 RepID=UPI001EEAC0F1|nr:uncharacterized protein LOC124354557 [Homalodisca vitripennis]
MERYSLVLIFGFSSIVLAGKDTDEELGHYVKNEPKTDRPWTSNERRINKMIEDEIIKYNYAPETTECPLDSQGKPKPTEGREPTWWNAYRQAKEGDRPDWSAEIRELIKNPRTYPPWTPSQESEPVQSRWKNIEPFTWRPGAPVVSVRLKTDATTRQTGTEEPTTERSIVLSSAHWDTSEEGGGGGGTEPPLNLAPLQKGYREDDGYLKVKPRKKSRTINVKKDTAMNSHHKQQYRNKKPQTRHNVKNGQSANSADDEKIKEIRMRRERNRRSRYNAQNGHFARV